MSVAFLSSEEIDVVLADTSTSQAENITASDVTLCVPIVSVSHLSTTSTYHDDQLIDAEFLTSPNQIQLSRTDGDEECICKVTILEFDATFVDIQTAAFDLAATEATDNVTIDTAVIAKTWCTASWKKTVEFGYWNDDLVTWLQTTTTNMQFEREATANAVNGHFWIATDVSSADEIWDCYHVEIASYEDFDETGTITSVTEAKTFVSACQRTVAASNRPGRISVAHLSSATLIKSERALDSGTVWCNATAVELLQDGDAVTRSSISISATASSGTDTITAVDADVACVQIPMRITGCKSDENSPPNSAFATIEYNSTTEVEANCHDDGTRVIFYESIQFHTVSTLTANVTTETAAFTEVAATTDRDLDATTETAAFTAPAPSTSAVPTQVNLTTEVAAFTEVAATPDRDASATTETAAFTAPAPTPSTANQVDLTPETAAFSAVATTTDRDLDATTETAAFTAPTPTPSSVPDQVNATPETAAFTAPAPTTDNGSLISVNATPQTAAFTAPTPSTAVDVAVGAVTFDPIGDRTQALVRDFASGAAVTAVFLAQQHLDSTATRTKEVTQTEDFSHADWVTSGSPTVTANDTTSPDGTVNADKISWASGASYVQQDVTATADTIMYLHVWAKSVDANSDFSLALVTNEGGIERVNFTTTDTWRRYQTETTMASGAVQAEVRIGAHSSSGNTSGCYFWGAGLEEATANYTFPTSYVPVTTVAVVRASDSHNFAKGGGLTNKWLLNQKHGIKLAPWWDYDETAADAYIYSWQDPDAADAIKDGHVFWDASEDKFTVGTAAAGVLVASDACTFVRGARITLLMDPANGTLEVRGCATGNGKNTGTGWSVSEEWDLWMGTRKGSGLQANGWLGELYVPHELGA